MFHHIFKRVLRLAERKSVHTAGLEGSPNRNLLRSGAGHPSSAFLGQILRTALAENNTRNLGDRAVHHFSEEPSPKPVPIPQDSEPPGGNVIRLVPRPRPAPEKTREPIQPDDDNDPGPSAA